MICSAKVLMGLQKCSVILLYRWETIIHFFYSRVLLCSPGCCYRPLVTAHSSSGNYSPTFVPVVFCSDVPLKTERGRSCHNIWCHHFVSFLQMMTTVRWLLSQTTTLLHTTGQRHGFLANCQQGCKCGRQLAAPLLLVSCRFGCCCWFCALVTYWIRQHETDLKNVSDSFSRSFPESCRAAVTEMTTLAVQRCPYCTLCAMQTERNRISQHIGRYKGGGWVLMMKTTTRTTIFGPQQTVSSLLQISDTGRHYYRPDKEAESPLSPTPHHDFRIHQSSKGCLSTFRIVVVVVVAPRVAVMVSSTILLRDLGSCRRSDLVPSLEES